MLTAGNSKSNAYYEANHVFAKYKPSADADIEHGKCATIPSAWATAVPH